MRGKTLIVAAWLAAMPLSALSLRAWAAPVAVTVQDKGRPTLCAEEDNVYATLAAAGVRRFEATARHPAYAASLKTDIQKPNFKHCHITPAKDFKFKPGKATLYQDDKVMVRGVTYPSYWRKETPAVQIAGKRTGGFHLLQLFVRDRGRWQEILVLHAPDGYWRLRPLPLPQFKEAVYGTSFLVGPVEEDQRPFVRITEVRIDPKAMSFTATYAKGGQAVMRVAQVDHHQLRVEASLDPAVTGSPFVALRSMYVAPDNADTAELRWTTPAGARKTAPAVGFGAVQATALAFGRSIPSRHNTSAPDLAFSGFDSGP